jgi:hypothetical protein
VDSCAVQDATVDILLKLGITSYLTDSSLEIFSETILGANLTQWLLVIITLLENTDLALPTSTLLLLARNHATQATRKLTLKT